MDRKIGYEVLGLEYGADVQHIKKAYRKLSHKFHPDKNNGDEFFTRMYLKIKDAYDYLTSNVKHDKRDSQNEYSSFLSIDEIYSEIKRLKCKLINGLGFDDLEQLICDRITNSILTISNQDKILKTKNRERIFKIVEEVNIISDFMKNIDCRQKLGAINVRLSVNLFVLDYLFKKDGFVFK